MEYVYSCLQGAFAGGIVGIALGPLSASGAQFYHRGDWPRFAAIVIGGTLGDGSLAAMLLLGTSFSAEHVTLVRDVLEHPYFLGTILVVMGAVGLKMAPNCGPADPEKKTTWTLDRFSATDIFKISFGWNFINGDTLTAFPLGVSAAGIGSMAENAARMIGFVPAALVATLATILSFNVIGRFCHRGVVPWIVRIASAVGIALGLYQFL